MAWTRIGGLLILCLAAGCAGKERAFEMPPPWTASQERPAATVSRPPAKAVPDPAPAVAKPVAVEPAPPAPPVLVAVAPVVAKPESPAASPTTSPQPVVPAPPPAQSAPKPAAPAAAAPEPPPAAAVPADQPAAKPAAKAPASPAPKKEAAAPAPTRPVLPKPAAATLDLGSLEKRLKETRAIGVFTKLTLKNQVDDLVNQFRAHYGGQAKTTLAALRQPYDQLVIKVLALLQDGDPSLARAIVESREAIWGILSDPEKFKNL